MTLKKIHGNLQKHPGNIVDTSWNFFTLEKWEPLHMLEFASIISMFSMKVQ